MEYVEESVKTVLLMILVVWSLVTWFILAIPSSAVLQVKEHRHIAVVYMENNNTEFQKELNLLVKKYTKEG
jgi:hypothetical protein